MAGVLSPKKLSETIKNKSVLLKHKLGPPEVYKIPLEKGEINMKGCKSFHFEKNSTTSNRTIMFLGATGAGKSTLINGMINYIFGVEWEDSFRFSLEDECQAKSQAYSQTSDVTVYKINHLEDFKIPFSLTIVDTPGFGDTRGIKRDQEITEQLRNLFSSQHGISEINIICFVAQSSLARLTPTQKYIFDSILSIFGKDVAENIRILVTFADGQKPPVLEAISESHVPCPKTEDGLPVHFKFNNSVLFADNKSKDDDFDKMFWTMGTKSMDNFFSALSKINPKSLTMTKEVLKERQQLEASVEGLQKEMKLGLAKLSEYKEMKKTLKDHEAEMSRNENFEFEVTVIKPVQVDISGTGTFITNCQQCSFTCHYPCYITNDADKSLCAAMVSNSQCAVCPGKCYWNIHFNQKYKWDYKEVKEKRIMEEQKEKYEKAKGKKMDVETLMTALNDDYEIKKNEVMKLIEKSIKCLNRLKEIALKPNPLSIPDYIDMLIEGEKHEAKPGWNERVKSLKEIKEKAELLAKIEKQQNLLTSFESLASGE